MSDFAADECRLCAARALELLIDLGSQPIAHHFQDDTGTPEYVHPLALLLCSSCGLIQVAAPIPPEELYTNYNWFTSWKPQRLVNVTLEWLSELSDLDKSAHVVEIGSNDGTFLAALRERGYARLLGVEPAIDAARLAEAAGVETMNEYLAPEIARQIASDRGPAQLVVARQVLEHIVDLTEFRQALAELLVPGGYIVIELPDFERSLVQLDYTTLWEEHVNYFTAETVQRFLGLLGAELVASDSFADSGGTLLVLARYIGQPVSGALAAAPSFVAPALRYGRAWPGFRQGLAAHYSAQKAQGNRIALYGAGWRSHALINFAGLREFVDFVLDDQPAKIGRYMPGAPVPVVAAEGLAELPVDLCLLAVNAESEDAVIASHQEFLERGGRFESLLPPSPRLAPFFFASLVDTR